MTPSTDVINPTTHEFAETFGIVTGGASGIGEAIARAYTTRGGQIAILDRDADRGRRVAEETGARFVDVDVTDARALQEAIAETSRAAGRLDHLFSNAGATGVLGSLLDISVEDWNATLDLLLTSTFVGIQSAARIMTAQGHGSMVCTASVASLRSGLGPHAYTVAKRGVLALVESAAVELVGTGVRVNAVAPGATVTGLAVGMSKAGDDLTATERRLAAASRGGEATLASDIADAALFLVGEQARRIHGSCLVIDGGEAVHDDRALKFFAR